MPPKVPSVVPTAAVARAALRKRIEPGRAQKHARFFRTGPGEYGAGDKFLGVTVPELRAVAREFAGLPLTGAVSLLKSPWHEDRLLALVILVRQFERGTKVERRAIYDAYMANTRYINNWDLVDCSAGQIVGGQLSDRGSAGQLMQLCRSPDLWERRIAMIATSYFTRRGNVKPALAIAERLVDDDHDLIQKAVGWMLREVGDRDRAAEERFLKKHCRTMPRTALRYAIEKFPPAARRRYLAGTP